MILWCVLAAAVISWTVTQEEIARPLRESYAVQRSRTLAYLLGCDYCAGFWSALAVLVWAQPEPLSVGYLLTWLLVGGGAGVVTTTFRALRQWTKFLTRIAAGPVAVPLAHGYSASGCAGCATKAMH